jgi:hypothetical protein
MSEQTTNGTTGKRGRKAGVTNQDLAYAAWRSAQESITNLEQRLREELERRAALAKIDAQAALARFQVFGGKVKDGKPVGEDGLPYVPTNERKAAPAPAEKATTK